MDMTQPTPEEDLRVAREQVDEATSALSRVLEADQELMNAGEGNDDGQRSSCGTARCRWDANAALT